MRSFEIVATAVITMPPTPYTLRESFVKNEALDDFWEQVDFIKNIIVPGKIEKIYEVSTTVQADDEEEAINQMPEYENTEIYEWQVFDLGY